MANRSVFPDSIDAFTELRDIQQAEVAEVKELKILRELASRTSEQDSRLNTLLIKYKNCIPSAELINLLQDAVANMESFYKYDIENGIITLKNQALAAIQDKLATINTYLDSTTAGALRTDIGVMANLPTTDKSSLVNAIVELFNGLAEPYVHPTTHSANIITISDAGNLIIATNAEEALQEIATKVNSINYIQVFSMVRQEQFLRIQKEI